MNEQSIQTQIDQINQKLDLLLDEVRIQKARREELEDLVSDLSIVGKDIFTHSVRALDKANIEVNTEVLTDAAVRVLRNIDNINEMLGYIESMQDFLKDAAPIARQVGMDAIYMFHDFERKGYFEFMAEMMKMADNIVTHFSKDDVRQLADNVVTIFETIKNLTQPDMLRAINNAVAIYKNLDIENVPEYSMWKAFRELNTPEMKRGMGFMITFLKNLSTHATELEKSKSNN